MRGSRNTEYGTGAPKVKEVLAGGRWEVGGGGLWKKSVVIILELV